MKLRIMNTSEATPTKKQRDKIRKRSGIPPSSPEMNIPSQLYSSDSYVNNGHSGDAAYSSGNSALSSPPAVAGGSGE